MTDRRESEFTLGTMEYDNSLNNFLVSEHPCRVFMHGLNSVNFFLRALISEAAFSQVPIHIFNDRWHHSVLSSLHLHDP